jgi:hypothetical protein
MKTLWVVLVLLTACSTTPLAQTPGEDELLVKASALTKVAATAESAIRYKEPSPDLSEQEFLEFSTRHDPSLLEPFTGLQLRALRKDGHAVVLVCNADGTIRLLEDAGCTAVLDRHHWRESESQCEFSVDPAVLCP